MSTFKLRDHDDPKRWADTSKLIQMGQNWARHAINWNTQPCSVGNIVHDQACAQEYLRCADVPPQWYNEKVHGKIYAKGEYRRAYRA